MEVWKWYLEGQIHAQKPILADLQSDEQVHCCLCLFASIRRCLDFIPNMVAARVRRRIWWNTVFGFGVMKTASEDHLIVHSKVVLVVWYVPLVFSTIRLVCKTCFSEEETTDSLSSFVVRCFVLLCKPIIPPPTTQNTSRPVAWVRPLVAFHWSPILAWWRHKFPLKNLYAPKKVHPCSGWW